jgi:hypothetical protein
MECRGVWRYGKMKKGVGRGLAELDRIVEDRDLMEEEITKRDECSQIYERTLFQEEVS